MDIEKVGLVTFDDQNRLLLVQKGKGGSFILPGGKPEADDIGEVHTLIRETHEEIQCKVKAPITYLGTFSDVAADRPDDRVHLKLYHANIDGLPIPSMEIGRIAWVDISRTYGEIETFLGAPLPPSLRNQVIPFLFDWLTTVRNDIGLPYEYNLEEKDKLYFYSEPPSSLHYTVRQQSVVHMIMRSGSDESLYDEFIEWCHDTLNYDWEISRVEETVAYRSQNRKDLKETSDYEAMSLEDKKVWMAYGATVPHYRIVFSHRSDALLFKMRWM